MKELHCNQIQETWAVPVCSKSPCRIRGHVYKLLCINSAMYFIYAVTAQIKNVNINESKFIMLRTIPNF